MSEPLTPDQSPAPPRPKAPPLIHLQPQSIHQSPAGSCEASPLPHTPTFLSVQSQRGIRCRPAPSCTAAIRPRMVWHFNLIINTVTHKSENLLMKTVCFLEVFSFSYFYDFLEIVCKNSEEINVMSLLFSRHLSSRFLLSVWMSDVCDSPS